MVGKKKVTKKKVTKKVAAKKVAPEKVEVTKLNVKKGDIVRAYNKNFLVNSVSQKKRSLVGVHLHYVEMRLTSDMSRTIAFDEVHSVWNKGD